MRIISYVFTAVCAALFAAPASAQLVLPPVYETGQFEPIPLGVPDFGFEGQASAAAAEITAVVRADLAGAGVFRLVEKPPVRSADTDISSLPDFDVWGAANGLIVGKAIVDPRSGQLTIQVRFYDVKGRRQLVGTQFTTPRPELGRRLGHRVADLILETLTGESGRFDSRFTYVTMGSDGARRLGVIGQDGAGAETLLRTVTSISSPRWSPSSDQLLYSAKSASDQWTLNLYSLTTGRTETIATPTPVSGAVFSPDERSIAYSRHNGVSNDIYIFDLGKRTERRLIDNAGSDDAPSFSPDGGRIVFVSDREGSPQLYIASTSGQPVPCNGATAPACRISSGAVPYAEPAWSRDKGGRLIAFRSIGAPGSFIGVMRPDGSGERLLTSGNFDGAPSWSPDGRVISFDRQTQAGGPSRIWTVDLTSRTPRPLNTPEGAAQPDWGPLLR